MKIPAVCCNTSTFMHHAVIHIQVYKLYFRLTFFLKKRFKGRLAGRFQHCSRRLIVLLPPDEFLHSSPEAPRTTQTRETSASEGRNYYQGIYLANPEFTKVPGSFTCRKAGTWDRVFYFPSEGKHAEDYSDTRKVQRLRPGSNPRTRVPGASMLTTRPPKPLRLTLLTNTTEGRLFWECNSFSVSLQFNLLFGIRRFITAFASCRCLFLSWDRLIQAMTSHSVALRSIVIRHHLRVCLTNGPLLQVFTEIHYVFLSTTTWAKCPVYPTLLNVSRRIIFGEEYKSYPHAVSSFFHFLRLKYIP